MRPKTITTTAPCSTRTTTATQTAAPLCQIVTPAPATYVQTTTATQAAVTVTATPPVFSVTVTRTPPAVTNAATITNPPSNVTATSTSTSTAIVTTTLSVADPQCTPGLSQPGGVFRLTYESFCDQRCTGILDEGNSPQAQGIMPNFPACLRLCDDSLGQTAIYNKVTQQCVCEFLSTHGTAANQLFDCGIRRYT